MRRHSGPPMRRCIGCVRSLPKEDLIRIVLQDQELLLDRDGRAEGRGVYLCRDQKCFEAAEKKKAFNRGFRCNIPKESVEKVLREAEAVLQAEE